MICVRLEGGLGNQLFQYAAGRSLALRLNTELMLDTSALLRNSRGVTSRQFELHQFRHTAHIANESESSLFPFLKYVAPFSRLISRWNTYSEKNVGYDEKFKYLKNNTYLMGYWQSFRYFSDIGDYLTKDFLPVNSLSQASHQIAVEISLSNAVAIHIRRGDYVSHPAALKHHGVLPLSYYNDALNYLNAKVVSPKYFVFSDDPSWCRNNLPLHEGNSIFVDHNGAPNAWQDLILMSNCRHHVIANSSFSWWGAWLGDQHVGADERLVFAPKNWFTGHNINTEDRLPSHWTVI